MSSRRRTYPNLMLGDMRLIYEFRPTIYGDMAVEETFDTSSDTALVYFDGKFLVVDNVGNSLSYDLMTDCTYRVTITASKITIKKTSNSSPGISNNGRILIFDVIDDRPIKYSPNL